MIQSFIDARGETFPLPNKFKPKFGKIDFSRKFGKRTAAHGSYVTGEGTAKGRKLTIETDIVKDNDIDFLREMERMVSFFLRAQSPIYYQDEENNRRWQVEFVGYDPNMKNTRLLRHSELSVDIMLLTPFPEAINEKTFNVSIVSDGDSVIITNPGSVISYAIVELIALDNVLGFRLDNLTNSTHSVIADTQFSIGSRFVLDAVEAKVKLNDVSRDFSKTDGGFILLDPGDNELLYESDYGQVQMLVHWRPVYAF